MNRTLLKMSKENVDQVIQDISNKTEKLVQEAVKTGEIMKPMYPLTIMGMGKTEINTDENKLCIEAIKSGAKQSADTLIGFMAAGSKEFEERTGRQLTYAEMRSMYG